MPELPEVETIKEQLKNKIFQKNIVKAEVFDKIGDSKIKALSGAKIVNILRRAKYLIIELDNKKKKSYLIAHLGMTGHFHYLTKVQQTKEKMDECSRFAIAKFYLDDGAILTYNNMRKFGFIKMATVEEFEKLDQDLGPEPLSKEFTAEKFKKMLEKKKNSRIKTLLMDQHFLSGLGNIYAQEALYYAEIRPERIVKSLSTNEIEKLHREIVGILKKAIEHKGSTVDNYSHMEGAGDFQNYLVVYQKDKCPKGHPIKREEMGGRGTSHCPICQK